MTHAHAMNAGVNAIDWRVAGEGNIKAVLRDEKNSSYLMPHVFFL